MLLATAAVALLAAAGARAETLTFGAALNGASEVPPNDSKGTGQVTATLDTATKAFTYKATYSGTTGPGVAAHFHGPAAAGANAPPVVMVATPASPISGTATLTDAQIADLKAGKWYFNVHTAAHAGGEIRGQLTAK
ncbi:MAG TPA: CHRD domain-containing protein [Caulobacteraceae bacterium]|nr:CHRD domain-containing protein [Caulobacteraceae bacterium]